MMKDNNYLFILRIFFWCGSCSCGGVGRSTFRRTYTSNRTPSLHPTFSFGQVRFPPVILFFSNLSACWPFFFFLISLFSLCFVVFLRSLPINIPFHRVTLMKGRASKSEPKHSNDSRRLVVAAPPFKSRIANFVIIPFCLILLIY